MVHLLSAAIGVFLLLVWLLGVSLSATGWMTWLLGVAGAIAVGFALIDRDEVSRVTRAQSLVCFAVAMYGVAFAGWSRSVPHWLWLAAAGAASAALITGLSALVSADRQNTTRRPAT